MPKTAVSLTLSDANLLWLRGRAASLKKRSLSEALDDLVTNARLGGGHGVARSVVGTIDIAADDPNLERADAAIQAMFAGSLNRPFTVHERQPRHGSSGPGPTRRGVSRRKPRRG